MRTVWPAQLARGTLVRFSIGLGAVEDLQADLARALLKLRGERGGGFAVRLTTFADSLVLSLMCVLGFGYNALYLAAVFALAVATSDALLGARGGW